MVANRPNPKGPTQSSRRPRMATKTFDDILKKDNLKMTSVCRYLLLACGVTPPAAGWKTLRAGYLDLHRLNGASKTDFQYLDFMFCLGMQEGRNFCS